MRWPDERYVKVYTRDTPDWLALGWEARALFWELLRKADRAGLLEVGKSGNRGIAALTGIPVDVVERTLSALIEDGCVEQRGPQLLIRNYIEAQNANQSDRARQQKAREAARDKAMREDAKPSQNVTVTGYGVTKRDTKADFVTGTEKPVTPIPSDPIPSDPIRSHLIPVICPETAEDEPSSGPPVDAVLVYPCDGKPSCWGLTQSQLCEWGTLYPSLDLPSEARKALAWVTASPERRKTAKGMKRFLVGWFSRTQDRGKQSGRGQSPERAPPDVRHGFMRVENCSTNAGGEVKDF